MFRMRNRVKRDRVAVYGKSKMACLVAVSAIGLFVILATTFGFSETPGTAERHCGCGRRKSHFGGAG